MNSRLREQAVKLRLEQDLSYGEIKKKLGVAKSTLSYWLREFPLKEERVSELCRYGWKKSESSREKFRITMRKKRELRNREIYDNYRRKFAKISKESFFTAGLMLYLGEGDKRRYERINLVNTDPETIKFFIKWVIEFLEVKREEIKVQLYLHDDMNIRREKKFWGEELGVSIAQFYKTQVRKSSKGSYSYKESSNHGTCGIYIMGVEKKRELMMAIQALLDSFLEKTPKGL
jgi:hypothetical protein